MDRTKRLGGLLLCMALLGSLLAGRMPASASTKLPVSRVGDVVHDRHRGRLIVSGSSYGRRVVAVSEQGRVVKTIDGLRGPAGMTLSDDALYVTQFREPSIVVMDPTALRIVEEIDISPYTGASNVARTGNYLWATVDCDGQEAPKLIAVDLTSGDIHEYPSPYEGPACTELLASPTEEDVLFTWVGAGYAGPLRRYRIESSPLPISQPPTMTVEAETDVSDPRDATIDPDGERLYLASERVRVFDAADLAPVRTYPKGEQAVAITPDEEYVVGGADSYVYDDVFVYRGEGPTAAFSARTAEILAAGGLAVTEDAARVFAFVSGLSGRVRMTTVVPWFTLRATKRQELGPAGYQGSLAWSETDAPGSRRLNAFAEVDGKKTKLNRAGTEGVVGGFDDGLVSFSERKGRRMDVVLYDAATGKRRDPGGKVNSRATEYLPGVSGQWLLFGRYTHGGRGRKLLLYNRESRQLRELDAARGGAPVLIPGQVNGPWAVWFDCTRQCTIYRYNIDTRKKIRVPRKKNTRDVSPSVAPDGTIYFERAGARCGRRATITSYRPGGRPRVIKELPPGIEVTATFYSEGSDLNELLIGRYNCSKGQFDIVKSHEL